MILPVGTSEFPKRQHFPVVTFGLCGLILLAFGGELALNAMSGPVALAQSVHHYGIVPALVSHGYAWASLITSLFLHAGFVHVLVNVIFLLAFGDNVEDQLGWIRFLGIFLLSGIFAGLVQVAVDPGSTVPILGASGGIAGVLAAYVYIFPRGQVQSVFFLGIIPIPLRFSAWLFIGAWFILQILNSWLTAGVDPAQPGVAYMAHVGGFVAGLILAWFYTRRAVQAA